MAGRSISGSIRSDSRAMAIRAPVLPADIKASASPAPTASIARRMLDLRPRRKATDGLSSAPTTSSVCTMRIRSPSTRRYRLASGRRAGSSPNRMKSTFGRRVAAKRTPRTTMRGASSPPIASTAIVILAAAMAPAPIAVGLSQSGNQSQSLHRIGGLYQFALPVMPARLANMVRQLEFAAIRALARLGPGEGIMGSAHVALGAGNLFSRYGHRL